MNQEAVKTLDEVVDNILNPTFDIEVEVKRLHWSERSKKPRIYIFPEGETVMEQFYNRRNRPIKMYRDHVLPEVFRQINTLLKTDLDLKEDKVLWSQYAGCSTCPCSPGFIFKGSLNKLGNRYEFFVTVSERSQ